MEKINFENLPSTNTPISAKNLNQMQSIIESGSNDNGNYIKFEDGTAICCKKGTLTTDVSIEMGSLYRSATLNIGSLPITLKSVLYANTNAFPTYDQTDNMCWSNINTAPSSTNFVPIVLYCPKSRTDVVVNYSSVVIGRWK